MSFSIICITIYLLIDQTKQITASVKLAAAVAVPIVACTLMQFKQNNVSRFGSLTLISNRMSYVV